MDKSKLADYKIFERLKGKTFIVPDFLSGDFGKHLEKSRKLSRRSPRKHLDLSHFTEYCNGICWQGVSANEDRD